MGFIEMTGNQLGPYIVGSFVVPHDINELQSVLDTPSTPPLTAEQRQIIQSAIDDIKKNDLPTYDYGASGAKKKDALARAKLSRQAKAETSGAVRTTGRERKKCNCIVGAYKDIKEKCADANCNGQAHHAVFLQERRQYHKPGFRIFKMMQHADALNKIEGFMK